MINPKLRNFKPTTNMISAAELVFKSIVYVDAIRPVVEGYKSKILKEMNASADPDWEIRGLPPTKITIETAYLMSDADHKTYCDMCDRAAAAAGFKTPGPGYCPLLIAESNKTEAEHLLIKEMKPITGLTVNKILCSPDGKGLERLKQYIDLTLRLLAPFVKITSKKAA